MPGLVMGFTDELSAKGATLSLHHDGDGSSAAPFANFPLSNLATRQLGQVCRIVRSGEGSTIIRASWSGANFGLAMVAAICGFKNLNGGGNSFVFKSFQDTTLRVQSETLNASDEPAFQLVVPTLLAAPSPATANRLEVWITSSDGTEETLDIGRLWFSQAFASLHGIGGALDTGQVDSGGVEISRGGQAYPRIGVVSRSVRVKLPLLESFETYGFRQALPTPGSRDPRSTVPLEEGFKVAGKTNEFVCFNGRNSQSELRPIYAHFEESPRILRNAPGYHSTELVMREEA